MSRPKRSFAWIGVAGLGVAFGHCLWGLMPLDVHPVVFFAVAGIGTIANAFFWAVLRRLDELKNVPGLDRDRRDRLASKVEARRGPILRRWVGSMISGIVMAIAGGVLKTSGGTDLQQTLVYTGYGAAAVLILTFTLLVVEYQTLSRLGPNLAAELRRSSEEHDFLQKVRA
jgi:hypothetical protein